MIKELTIFLGVMMGIALLLQFAIFLLTRNQKTSDVLNALSQHFIRKNERITELRGTREKVQTRIREFEVKTIRRNYYRVRIKGITVLSTDLIEDFSITEEGSFIRAVIDPMNLSSYEVMVNEKAV